MKEHFQAAELWRHLVMAVTFVSAIALMSAGWAQTRDQISKEEGAAGVGRSPAQRNTENKGLQQIDQILMRQEQPTSPMQQTAPK